jgi:hypothetical protein
MPAPGAKLAHPAWERCVFVASTVRHVPRPRRLDRVFPQVIDGLGSGGPATYQVVGKTLCLTTVKCLTLMPVVSVKFLTVINGHAG